MITMITVNVITGEAFGADCSLGEVIPAVSSVLFCAGIRFLSGVAINIALLTRLLAYLFACLAVSLAEHAFLHR